MNAKVIDKIAEELSKLTVRDAVDLVEKLKEQWNITNLAAPAAAPVQAESVSEEKTKFDVELSSVGDKKISVIKVVREITGLGLKEAKDMVEGAPVFIKQGLSKSDADAMKAKLEETGAKIELK